MLDGGCSVGGNIVGGGGAGGMAVGVGGGCDPRWLVVFCFEYIDALGDELFGGGQDSLTESILMRWDVLLVALEMMRQTRIKKSSELFRVSGTSSSVKVGCTRVI